MRRRPAPPLRDRFAGVRGDPEAAVRPGGCCCAVTPPRTPSCSCCGTRMRCRAGSGRARSTTSPRTGSGTRRRPRRHPGGFGARSSRSPPGTFLARHRRFIAATWHYSRRCSRSGRPPTRKAIERLIPRPARENPPAGAQEDPGRAHPARPPHHGLHGLGDPPRCRRRPGPASLRPDPARVPHHPGRRGHRLRLPAHQHRAGGCGRWRSSSTGTRRLHVTGVIAHPTRADRLTHARVYRSGLCR